MKLNADIDATISPYPFYLYLLSSESNTYFISWGGGVEHTVECWDSDINENLG